MNSNVSAEKFLFADIDHPLLYSEGTASLFKAISHPLKRWPDYFDKDIQQELFRFIGQLNPAFIRLRNVRHLVRMFCSSYLMRKSMNRALYFSPHKRQTRARILQTKLTFPFQSQPVLGILGAISLQNEEGERFGEKHMSAAILAILPQAEIVKGSFYACPSQLDPILTAYVEIVKKNGTLFSLKEKKQLSRALSEEFAKRIERTCSISFNLHREEEVMKNIELLKQELASSPDLPQAMIFFSAKNSEYLSFQIILVRTIRKTTMPLDECFASLPVQFISDYRKSQRNVEIDMFRLQIPIGASFLRTDLSINLYEARHQAVSFLHKAIGKVRDYNGGVFAQQRDRFSDFKSSLPEIARKDPDLLDRFFHALSPAHMQALLPLDVLKDSFRLFLKILRRNLSGNGAYRFLSEETEYFLLVMISTEDPSFPQQISDVLKAEQGIAEDLATISLTHQGLHVLGHIYHSHSKADRLNFLQIVQSQLKEWKKKSANFQSLRISVACLPLSLDPRLGGDEQSRKVLQLLFEGLSRIGKNGVPEPALAEKIEISPDGKSYLFTLRESFWNNGEKVRAMDFAYAWKKILSPGFPSVFAHLFYPIKNAQAVKEAKTGIEDVGIKALDENTLKVDLEHPCPYFLELTAHSLYSPIHERIDFLHPQWSVQEGESYVCNGPFQLKKLGLEHYELISNPFYWDRKEVKLSRIFLVETKLLAALQLFKKGEIDYLDRSLQECNPRCLKDFPESKQLLCGPCVFWLVFNTQRFPFHEIKLRKSLALALDRQVLIEMLGASTFPAFSPLPSDHLGNMNKGSAQQDRSQSLYLFREALKDLGFLKGKSPQITLSHSCQGQRKNIVGFIQEQWEQTFDLRLQIENCVWQDLFQRISEGDFEMAILGWRSPISDPIYTLNAFRYRNDTINFSGWENPRYQELLRKADAEQDLTKRLVHLVAAEAILIEELPVIPLIEEHSSYVRRKNLAGIMSAEHRASKS